MFYVELTQHLLVDISQITGIDLSRDALEIERRVRFEGLQFLTVALPRLGKELDSYLGAAITPSFVGFKTDEDGIPRFLGGLIREVYPIVKSELVLKHLRQILYVLYKVEFQYDESIQEIFLDKFVQTDSELPDDLSHLDPVLDLAARLCCEVTGPFQAEKIRPKHGPGTVSDRKDQHEKMGFKRIFPLTEQVFPFFEWFVPCPSAIAYYNRSVLEFAEPVAKIVLVPKDSRGPRIISCEPTELQYLQQGVASELIRCVHKSRTFSGRVNFLDQTINQKYAKAGSAGFGWVTLDMKDASDRVSLALVRRLFEHSGILHILEATRSSSTRLPDGRLVHMKKFAPMGSALCFPVESIVFYALAVAVLVVVKRRTLREACRSLKVYGDDMIVASEDYEAILEYFPKVGLMFNLGKCCTAGFFRESCGVEAYKGLDIKPARVRTVMSSCLMKDAATLSSWCSYQRAFWSRGYWALADWLRSYICRRVELPVCTEENSEAAYLYLLGHTTHWPHTLQFRFNSELHRPEVFASVVVAKRDKHALSGYERLHWNFSGVSFDCCDVPSFPVRYQVSRKYRWCTKVHGN
jgi:hypothetical protein